MPWTSSTTRPRANTSPAPRSTATAASPDQQRSRAPRTPTRRSFTECASGGWATDWADNLVWDGVNLLVGHPQLGPNGAQVEHRPRPVRRAAPGGCTNRAGIVTIDRGTGAVTYNHDYYSIGTRAVRPSRRPPHRPSTRRRPGFTRSPSATRMARRADRGERERECPAVHRPLGRAVVPVHAAARVDRDLHLERLAGRAGRARGAGRARSATAATGGCRARGTSRPLPTATRSGVPTRPAVRT